MADLVFILCTVFLVCCPIHLLLLYIDSRLPSKKLSHVNTLLDRASSRLNHGTESGQIPGAHAAVLRIWLWRIWFHVDNIQLRIYLAHTWRQELLAWWRGRSGELEEIRNELRYYHRMLNVSLRVRYEKWLLLSLNRPAQRY
ncbi:hypothetical protein GY45DRAFT_179742 [Cubamyces sp. BRFM 1775]|nr:hypothetical protein GY45DRAFT_179742 [Cubamyces sp. BRFM 1775]